MFGLLKKKKIQNNISLKISGMHCASCALRIDDTLESLPEIEAAHTSYKKNMVEITLKKNQSLPLKAINKMLNEFRYSVEET